MSRFLLKSIPSGRYSLRNTAQTTNPNACHTLRWFSLRPNKLSFTASYLKNSLGFSENAALAASKRVSFKTPRRPDKAIEFLKNFGFTQTQISKLVRSFPQVLVFDAEKTLLPKLEFLESKGISRPELVKAVTPFPLVLSHSLDRQIVPGYEFFLGFFRSDEKVVSTFRKHPNVLVNKLVVGRNIAVLREHCVPVPNIATLLQRQPRCFLIDSTRFRGVVEEVAAMGFEASKMSFVVAVFALRSFVKSNWEAKVELYKKWGWSDGEFLEAFRREPRCMMVSEGKISACMEYLTEVMGLRPCVVVKYPLTVALSLEKRVVPRCSVYRLLVSKGLVTKPVVLSTLLCTMENKFLRNFVVPYKDHASELLKLYEEKLLISNGREDCEKV